MTQEFIIKLVEISIWPIFSTFFLMLIKDSLKERFKDIREMNLPGGASLKFDSISQKIMEDRMKKYIDEKLLELKSAGFSDLKVDICKNSDFHIDVKENGSDKYLLDLAERFNFWMKKYNHPNRSDVGHLLSWLVAGGGADEIGDDYQLFSALAKKLNDLGYDTLPTPGEAQFQAKLKEHEKMTERMAKYR